jgi:hypothetical protein
VIKYKPILYALGMSLFAIPAFAEITNDTNLENQYDLGCVSEEEIPIAYIDKNLTKYDFGIGNLNRVMVDFDVQSIIGQGADQLLSGYLISNSKGRYFTHDPLKMALRPENVDSKLVTFFVKSIDWNCQLRRHDHYKGPIGNLSK